MWCVYPQIWLAACLKRLAPPSLAAHSTPFTAAALLLDRPPPPHLLLGNLLVKELLQAQPAKRMPAARHHPLLHRISA